MPDARERVMNQSPLRELNGPSGALTARELECMRLIADGKIDREIAAALSISATTVKFHVNAARRKLGARTRAQAVARLVLSGLF